MPAVVPLACVSPGELNGNLPGDQPELGCALSTDLTELNRARSMEQMELNLARNRSDLGRTLLTDWSRQDGAPSPDRSDPVACSSAGERALPWLLVTRGSLGTRT